MKFLPLTATRLIVPAAIYALGSAVFAFFPPAVTDAPAIRVVHHELPPSDLTRWRSMVEERVPMPGYRVSIPMSSAELTPSSLPVGASRPNLQRASEHVATRLATDGLLPTLASVIEIMGPAQFGGGAQVDLQILRETGLPVDLFKYYSSPDSPEGESYAVVREVLRQVLSRNSRETTIANLRRLPFEFRKSSPAFYASADSGGTEIELFRLQLPRGDYWRGVGDGSGLDIARQIVEASPDASFMASIEKNHVDALLGFARQWPLKRAAQLTIITEYLPVAQWAQDNGKAGMLLHTAADSAAAPPPTSATPATLVPRYACRGEEGTIFVPGETLLLDGLTAAGHSVIQSPLLFQGGNILIGDDPVKGQRLLLLGEAEIDRNLALGLSRDEVIRAFAVEFDAQVVEVLPAVSYHIDYEVSLRATGEGLTAFVNDTPTAVKIVLRLGTQAMHQAGLIDSSTVDQALTHLNEGGFNEYLTLLGPILDRAAVSPGRYAESLADHFTTGMSDSGVGNFQRFLLAMDLARVHTGVNDNTPGTALREYLESFKRRNADREELWSRLRKLGLKIVPIPSLAEEDLSLNYLNGLHARNMYFMPASGGFYSKLDHISRAAFEAVLENGTRVIPVTCAESQRRLGAVRCAVAAYGRPSGKP